MNESGESNDRGHEQTNAAPATPRRRKMKWIAVGSALALALALIASAPVWARHGGQGWHDKGAFIEFMLERKLRDIDASEEQREQILAIATETREAILALRDPSGLPHQAFVEQLVGDPGDREELEALRATQLEKMETGSEILVDGVARMSAVLTAEQRERLAEMHRARHERWHH